jgi:hypothetical protein
VADPRRKSSIVSNCKYSLGDILRQLGIPADAPNDSGINQINVTLDEFAKGFFGAFLDISPQ